MATSPFVIVPSLTAIAVAYSQKNLIADMLLPRVMVDTQAFRYIKYALGDAFKIPDTRVGRKGAPNQLDWGSTELTDQTFDEGLDSPVPNADMMAWEKAQQAGSGYVSQVDPISNATVRVTGAVQNRREFRASGLITNLANYATANKVTLSGTGQWSDYTNSDPLSVIMTAFDSMVMRPNIGWMGRQVATKLTMHPKVCKAVFGQQTDAGIAPMRAIADLLGLDDIYVGDAWIDTAAPGQASVLSRAWGKDCGFMYRNMTADTRGGVTFGMTAQWGDKVAGTIEDPDVGLRGGQRVRSGESVKELITANDLGYLFKAAVA
jgi:hypothetical protein